MTMNNVHSWVASVARLGRGLVAWAPATEPEQLITLYEFEACPFCRKVRDVLSELDLDWRCVPCARGSAHRAEVKALGGREQFPFLVDPNTGTSMYESEDIITYLRTTYGPGRSALSRLLAPLDTLGAAVTSAVRPRGRRVRQGVQARTDAPELELYGFEASPYCRKVREELHELDLPFVVRNVAKRGRRRPELVARGGRMMVPCLIDAADGVARYESDDIVAWLRTTYAGASA